ncbi:MAG: amidohydrolase [Gracilimonas sp.]|uniref:M20 metallopeptidase family protein n=1 Tax=Gracilimonas sp. TaxID=1974203 RepID=UPI0019B8E008|nr:amidohydrolase [Gracilimonas sp.]MBD3616485.1 amidohydrolase [Gracilimonas sp.]
MHSKIKELAKKYFSDTISTRKYLHQHPEVSFKEFETTKFIKNELDKLKIPYESPLETGCVGILEGGKKSDRVIALRADIDALPILEQGETKSSFISKNEGVAHCCGHDAHTSNLLTSARILKELQSEIEGKILLVFQPGEEKLPGGGKLLSETGFLQKHKVQAIYGLHTSPMHKPGTIATKPGPLMASTSEFEVEIIGKGGHAARAHEAIDPVVLSAQYVNAIQTIASRNVDPAEPVVVTIGKIEGGTAHNIIPEKVKLWGTARTLLPETEDLVIERLEALAKGITESAGGGYTFSFNKGYPSIINTEKEAETVLSTMKKLFGEESALEMRRPVMAGEDFAFYLQHFPGAFFFVGSGSEESDSLYPWHHPKYNVDDRFFEVAIPLMVSLAFDHQ